MKTMKLTAITLVIAIAFSAVAFVAKAEPAKAFTNENLGSLIVTNGLFTGYSAQNLAGLIATDAATSGGGFAGGGSTNLNNLLVLSGLFGTGGGWGWGWGNNAAGLAGLIAVNNMAVNGF